MRGVLISHPKPQEVTGIRGQTGIPEKAKGIFSTSGRTERKENIGKSSKEGEVTI